MAKTHREDPLISPEEVGRRIGKTGATVIEWIRSGLLEAVPMPSKGPTGKRFMVRTSTVNKLLDNSSLRGKKV